MCGFYCIVFIQFTRVRKTFLNYTDLFSPNDLKKNDKNHVEEFDKYDKTKRRKP